MSDRIIKLLLIDPDSIYRTGLRVVLEKFADLQIIAEAQTSTDALQILSRLTAPSTERLEVDVTILALRLESSPSSLDRQIKTQYPQMPVLLLTSDSQASVLAAAKQAGVEGYCPKGISVPQLVTAIRQVAAGNSYWIEETGTKSQKSEVRSQNLEDAPRTTRYALLARVRDRWRFSGLRHIDTTLAQVRAQLEDPGLPLLERAVFAGQRRELLAARWLLNQLLAAPVGRRQEIVVTGEQRGQGELGTPTLAKRGEAQWGLGAKGTRGQGENLSLDFPHSPPHLVSPSSLFASVRAKLQFSLLNLTRVPLEIDILREEKKQELLALILQKIEDVLGELRFSQVQLSQLSEIKTTILVDLWQAATTDFFGKYSKVQVGEYQVNIVNTLLQDSIIIQTAILEKIPLIEELFAYLLFDSSLAIDNATDAVDSIETKERAEIILQNLLIQLANGVMQPLLNRFADIEAIKQKYYDRSLISTREIERFRNNLSWKYRLQYYFQEPTKIFESRYELFLIVSRGIAKISIYAPRRQELTRLSGIPFLVTLALEIRDAIAPRLRAVVAFFGKGIVYVLTQVIGRAIGLIGRGILQGLGGSLQESKNKR